MVENYLYFKPPKLVFFYSFFLSFLLLPLLCFGAPLKNNGYEMWLQDSMQKQIKDHFSYCIGTEFRFRKNASELYFTYAQFFLVHHPYNWLEWAAGYRHQNTFQHEEDKWKTSYNPLGDIIFYFSTGEWKWQNRNRFQYLIHSSTPNLLRYRYRLRLVSPWKLTPIKLTPFSDNELFFEERKGFFQDRFLVGTLVDPTDYMTLETFFMLRFQDYLDKWRRHKIIGIYLSLKF